MGAIAELGRWLAALPVEVEVESVAEAAAEAEVIQSVMNAEEAGALPAAPPERHAAATGGLMRAALMRRPAWGERPDCRPAPGAWCGCCGRNPPAVGGKWWQEAEAPKGWRCVTCYPPTHLPEGRYRIVES